MAERIVTRAFIIDSQNRVLIGLRTKERKWALIGGKPNQDEPPTGALKREIREELRTELIGEYFYNMSENITPGQKDTWTTLYYTGRILGRPNLNKDEILEIKYITERDLGDLDIAFDHKKRLKDFFKYR